jgi:hypothetical protein
MNISVYCCKKLSIICAISVVWVSAQTWTSKTPIPTPRWYPASVLLDGKIYVIGGQDSTYPYQSLNIVEIYDLVQDTWQARAPMNIDRWGLAAAVVNGKIYAIGGRTGSASQGHAASNAVEEYDPQTNAWISKTAMPTPRGYCGWGVYYDTVFVFGGRLVNAVSAVEKYYPADDSWSADPHMPYGRYTFATARVDTLFYLIGGWSNNTVQAYNLNTRTWSYLTPMPTSRGGSGVGTIGGFIYVVGGRGGVGDEFERYDTSADSWTTLTPMPTAREGLTASVVENELYAITGSVPISQGGLPYYGENEKASDLTAIAEPIIDEWKACQLNVYPNPCRGRVTITCVVPPPCNAELSILDSSGRIIKKLYLDQQTAENKMVDWTCRDDEKRVVPAGVYFVNLRCRDYNRIRKFLITQ